MSRILLAVHHQRRIHDDLGLALVLHKALVTVIRRDNDCFHHPAIVVHCNRHPWLTAQNKLRQSIHFSVYWSIDKPNKGYSSLKNQQFARLVRLHWHLVDSLLYINPLAVLQWNTACFKIISAVPSHTGMKHVTITTNHPNPPAKSRDSTK